MTATGGKARIDFLSGTGEMGERIRAFDWTSTPLGEIEQWPQSLKTSVGLILSSRHPMWIGWGRDRTFLYNDAYLHVLGPVKHPSALGQPTSEVWAEIWDVCGPLADKVFDNGEATFVDDVRLIMDRGDFLEETFYSFSYSPIRDDDGTVSGLFCPSTDVTPKVLNGRRLATLSELAGHALAERTTSAACAAIAQTLSKNADDIPFGLLYLADASGRRATLEQQFGAFGAGFAIAPFIDLEDSTHGVWPVAEVYRTGSRQTVNVKAMDGIPRGVADRPVAQAVVLPVASHGEHLPYGVLIAGVNPCRPLDTEHFTFFELIAGQVATAVQNARVVEEERKRADMLAEIDRAKTVFFSNVSHEFRTPLTLMLGPMENLLAKPRALRAEDHEQLVMAHRNSLRLLKLVNSLLDFSRLEAGRLQASYAPTDLCALTTDLASNFRSAMQNAGLELIVDCSPLPEPVYVDGEMWEKIVLNLLSNAFKFTFEGRVTVRIQAVGGNAVLTVADTGIGLPEEELPRIFERFHRVEGARGRSDEGTGIGLALIHEYVKLHAGQISVASRLGEGTTFTVTVPLGHAHLPQERIKRADIIRNSASFRAEAFSAEAVALLSDGTAGEEAPPVEHAASAAGTRPRIVLADDNPDMREHVRRILGAEYDVTIARNGREALDEIRRNPPDLVLSDVMMPELDGFDLLRALRRDPNTQTLPVIFLSARAGEEMRIEGLAAGADDYLVKPFTASELLARVGTHVKMSMARRRAMEREAALRAEAEQARDQATNVLESITDAFLGIDKDWRIIYANAEAERLNGMRREDMLGKDHWELFPAPPTSSLFQQLTLAATEKVAVEFDNFYQPWQRWFHVKAYPAREGGVSVFYTDITDRKRIEDELRHQQELREAEGRKWRDLFFQVPAAIAVLRGPSHIYEACNDRHVSLVGRTSAEELLHKPIAQALPEIDGRTELLDRIYRTGEPVVAQEVAIHLGAGPSRERYLNYVMLPTRDDDGEVNGILAHATDVTDLVRARKHVEESEKRFASAFAEAPIGMVLTTPTGRILEANRAYMDTLGYSREELISQQDSRQFTHPEDVEVTRQFYAGLREGGADTGLLEKRYLRKDGAIVWARCSATMRRDSAGQPDQLIAIIEDITEQKLAREALRESEARFRQLADSMPQIVTTTLPDGSVDYLNERWFEFTGMNRTADLSDSWASVMHAEDLPRVMECWRSSLATGLDYSQEYRLWDRRQGRWRWFIGRALSVRGLDGKIVKWLGTATDIDDQKRVEEELRRANQDLEQFAYSASHDLQEPLRSIKIYGDLLKRRYRHKLDGQALEFCDYMHSGATRMEMLVSDLLAYTQVTRLEAPVEDTDAKESLEAAIANLNRAIAESGAEITDDQLPSVRVHSTHLRQLFQNLIGNAIKYRSPDRVPLIHVSSERQQGLWVFAVRDNGIGIETEYKEHIFGLFKRLHTSDEYSGTGIGLAICQRIVERYHGRIWVESSPGAGSTFFFSIPV